MVLQDVFAILFVLLHDHKLAMIDVPQILEILDTEMVPLHQENSSHQAVRDQHTNAGKAVLPE
jgi:hypothetical protein